MNYSRKKLLALGLVLALWQPAFQASYAASLTLGQAEQAALSQSPEVKSQEAKTRFVRQSAIAAGQLSDPKLMLGAMNMPVDSFDFSQEPMTQVQVGLMQAFPRGRSLHYRSIQKNDLSRADEKKKQIMQLQVLQGVRLSWVNLYYWRRAREIVLKQKKVARHLVKVTEYMLGNNKAQQKDVILAQLELTQLDDRLLSISQQIGVARAALARWVGPDMAKSCNPKRLPIFPLIPKLSVLYGSIMDHPVLKSDEALVSSSLAGIHLAQQQYKPGFNVGIAYGFRQGNNVDGTKRTNFLTAQASMDLPFFTHNRQDRTLKSSRAELRVNEENKMSHYRLLREVLKKQYVTWQQKRKRVWLYSSKLIPEAKQYAEATMIAYQNTQTDFPTLARAYLRELNAELSGLKENVSRDIARINLLYLQGE